ncbi:MAG: internal scaffolding protein [Microvirus sp.]|nr:MAG: internal scaffolding protein [Microvirus sp.]
MRERGIDLGIFCDPKDPLGRSMTRQSFAKDADINTIMSRYAVSGVLADPANVDSARVARFGDFSDLVDYGHLLQRVQQAQEDFMTLPAVVRARFDNDVENCLDFVTVPENVFEAVKLGLVPETMLEATFLVRPDLRPVVKPDLADPVATPVKPA